MGRRTSWRSSEVSLPSARREELALTLRNDFAELARASTLVDELLARHVLPEHVVYGTQLAIEEVVSNVIRHGHRDGGSHEIALLLRVGDGHVEIQVVDDGIAFDPVLAPDVELGLPLERRKVGGLGIRLVRQFASEMRYERSAGRNRLWLRI